MEGKLRMVRYGDSIRLSRVPYQGPRGAVDSLSFTDLDALEHGLQKLGVGSDDILRVRNELSSSDRAYIEHFVIQ